MDLGNIEITSVKDENDLEKFITLPSIIYVDNPYWPGQIDENERALHNPNLNFPLRYLDTQLFLAIKNEEVVGRISVTINEAYNKRWNESIGFFGHFECINDQEVANSLLWTAEHWVKEKGKNGVKGPINYTYYGTMGILIKGFQKCPTIDLAFTPEYYQSLLENAGYSKTKDLYEILAPVEKFVENSRLKRYKWAYFSEDPNYIIRSIDENNLTEEWQRLLHVYNNAFSQHWAFNYLESDEWLAALKAMQPIVPNKLFLIAEHMGQPVAFILPEMDYNQVLFNTRHGIQAKINRIKLLVIAVLTDYQKYGVGKWILSEFIERVKQEQYEELSISWVDEENFKSINLCISMGGIIDKIFRVYDKVLLVGEQ